MKSAWPAMSHSKSLIPTYWPQEFNPHHAITATTLTHRNDDGLIVPVVPEYATPNCAARQAISDPLCFFAAFGAPRLVKVVNL